MTDGSTQIVVVDRDSASIGLPGNVENIVELTRSHSDLCRFDTTDRDDLAVYKHVQGNMRRIYDKIKRMEELRALNAPSTVGETSERMLPQTDL